MNKTRPLEAFLWGCALGLVLIAFLALIAGCGIAQPDMDTSTEQGRQRAIALHPGYQPQVAAGTPAESAQRAWERRVRAVIPCEGGEASVRWPNRYVSIACPVYDLRKDGTREINQYHWEIINREVP